MGFHKLVNTAYFSEAATEWHRNGGFYTKAPPGSRDYTEYWEEQDRRCKMGYSVGDLWIPGRMYFYLNFTPIWKVPDHIAMAAFKEGRDKRGKMGALTSNKIFDFPRFYEISYEWWNFKHIAWHGGEFMGIRSPGAKHIGCGKARGAGWSYQEAADGVYNYNFIPGSKSYYFAGIEQYLTTDGIMNKAQAMLDFINDNSAWWLQNRQKKNTLMHMRASYMDGFSKERGSMSELIGVIVDDPQKTRGKRGRKITFEEGGSFRNLKQALTVSQASIKDGDIYVGQITVLGTGGEEGPDIEGLEEVFYDPASFDMLEFPNIWEEGLESTSCGYFVPVWRTKSSFMDQEGNVDVEGAILSEKVIRKKKAKAKDPKILDGWKAEYPFRPSEMFNRFIRNRFNVAEVRAQIKRIQTSQAIQGMIRHGDLKRDPKEGVVFVPQPKSVAKPVEIYPHNSNPMPGSKERDDLEGCVTIVAQPYRDAKGKVPEGMYQLVFDPFYKEESEDLTSLASVQIWKQYNQIDPVDEGLPVAWFDGRPQDINRVYEIAFMLADLYNCTLQGEIAGGGQGFVDYARITKQLDKLEYEPEMLGNKDYQTASSLRNRSRLMNMPTEKKRLGMTYLVNWHTHIRGVNDLGHPVLNIHRCYYLGMLYEMLKGEGKNTDRLSAGAIAQFMLKENAYREEARGRETEDTESVYNRQLFGSEDLQATQRSSLIDLY